MTWRSKITLDFELRHYRERDTSATQTNLSGNILFNDEIPVNKETFQKYCGYVQQDDVLFATFQVKEALEFAARLKLKVPIEE